MQDKQVITAAEQAVWHAGLDEGRAQVTPAAVAVPDGWEPTVENINALPDPLRAYVHALETNADPSGMVRDNTILREQLAGLQIMFRKSQDALAATPAAVEVPAEGDPAALLQLAYLIESGRGMNYVERKEIAVALRVLAATPAAAAPVVLPEPASLIAEKLLALARIVNTAVEDWGESSEDNSMDVKFHSDVVTEMDAILDYFDSLPDGPDENVIESGPAKAARILRALLAGVSAPAAEGSVIRWVSNGVIGARPTTHDLREAIAAAEDSQQCDCDDCTKAQADARDAQLLAFAVSEIRRDEMEHEPVLYVSKGQLGNFRDPDGPDSTAHGRYLPVRVTPSGKFTTPLFAPPQALADARDADVLEWLLPNLHPANFGLEFDNDKLDENWNAEFKRAILAAADESTAIAAQAAQQGGAA